jgi:hypothetical protein
MIIVRNIFNLKFGKAKDAKALLKEGLEISKKFGFGKTRALTDLTGDSYRLILESEWKSLSDWENSMKEGMGASDWQKWYQKFIPLVDSASRELLNIVD